MDTPNNGAQGYSRRRQESLFVLGPGGKRHVTELTVFHLIWNSEVRQTGFT